MDKRRPVRNSALRAQQTFAANGSGPHASSDDDEIEARPTTRTTRRGARVDLYKLDASSLQRYRKHYKLGDPSAEMTKEEMVPVVQKHFSSQPVEEEEVLLRFIQGVQHHNKKLRQHHQAQQQALESQIPPAHMQGDVAPYGAQAAMPQYGGAPPPYPARAQCPMPPQVGVNKLSVIIAKKSTVSRTGLTNRSRR